MGIKVTLGHSPDADDAFMFYGLSSGKVSFPGITFEHFLQDIQTLNEWAKEGRLDLTALSVYAYAYVGDRYEILAHGASMGDGYGPLVVSLKPLSPSDLKGLRIAIPGYLTSAYLTLCLFQPHFEPVFYPFDQIIPAVAQGEVEAGLLIHEGQLTHSQEGLHPVIDLGWWWKQETGLPLPLGINGVKRELPETLKRTLARAMRDTILYALQHRSEALEYALQFARGMGPALADRFIGMYVNDLTLDLGERGREAIHCFLNRGVEAGWLPEVPPLRFVSAED